MWCPLGSDLCKHAGDYSETTEACTSHRLTCLSLCGMEVWKFIVAICAMLDNTIFEDPCKLSFSIDGSSVRVPNKSHWQRQALCNNKCKKEPWKSSFTGCHLLDKEASASLLPVWVWAGLTLWQLSVSVSVHRPVEYLITLQTKWFVKPLSHCMLFNTYALFMRLSIHLYILVYILTFVLCVSYLLYHDFTASFLLYMIICMLLWVTGTHLESELTL